MPQKTIQDTIWVPIMAQKTRKLNPQPNLVTRAKSLEILENTAEDYPFRQEKKVIESKNMKPKRATPLPSITTTNRYSILATDLHPHQDPSNFSTSSSTLLEIKKKNETLRGKMGTHSRTIPPIQSSRHERQAPACPPGGTAPPASPRGDRAPDEHPRPQSTHRGAHERPTHFKGTQTAPNQHNAARPERHGNSHGEGSKHQAISYQKNPLR
jgi:hypothetical protein